MGEMGLTKSEFLMKLLAIGTKIIRSVGFNVVMLVVGYILGFGTMQLITHMAWTRNQNYEVMEQLEENLKQQRIIDDRIDRNIRDIKLSIVRNKTKNDH